MNIGGCGDMYRVFSSTEDVDLEVLDKYPILIQQIAPHDLKVFYRSFCEDEISSFIININEGQVSSCIKAMDVLFCQEGLIGLDWEDVLCCMSNCSSDTYYYEFVVENVDGEPVVMNIDKAKELCKSFRRCVVLMVGDYSLMDFQSVIESLYNEDVEMAYQLHYDGEVEKGKLYIWGH